MQVELKKTSQCKNLLFCLKNRTEKVWAKLAGSYETFKFSLFTGSLKNYSTILSVSPFSKARMSFTTECDLSFQELLLVLLVHLSGA